MNAPDLYSLSAYKYELPEELIAQYPLEKRDSSRLMIIDRANRRITETTFRALQDILHEGDGLIFNDTRVVPARLLGTRKNGGQSEVFLTRRYQDGTWEALVRPGKKLPIGAFVQFNSAFSCEIIGITGDGGRRVRFHCQGEFDRLLEECGQIPLPHYIRRDASKEDVDRYQTVYARNSGALAAPTAGLHFSQEMLRELDFKGVSLTQLTLHTGLGTFRPVHTEDIRAHTMHSERYVISSEAAQQLNLAFAAKKFQVCVGTTTCRALEAAASAQGYIQAGEFDTNIFVYPGYTFKYVRSMLTNFHLPGSTLLMLVCAFGGYDLVMEAYAKAVKDRFRFFSYGDAMLII